MRWIAWLLVASVPASAPLFEDVTGRAGISWKHFNGESTDRFLVEIATGGLAFLDFDQDGRLDLFLVNSGETPRGRSQHPVRNALYRNLGDGHFEEVAGKAAVDKVNGYGMGAAACDLDNDGYPELLVTGFPQNTLYWNLRNGAFRDVTVASGIASSPAWGTSAACLDYDRDGLLDIFIANYVRFSFDSPKSCDFAGEPTYCAQTAYEGLPPRLYRNLGGQRFADVSRRAGIDSLAGRALGAVAIDADADGWVDLFVARDASPNLLLINTKQGAFRDQGLDAEVAFTADGAARAGMGVDAGDVDGNGHPDFIVTNFDTEYHALYLNDGRLPLREATVASGLAMHTKPFVGWGVRLVDFDNDGDLDALIVNGHLHQQIEKSNRSVQYREPPLLLLNNGKATFSKAGNSAGSVFARSYLGRGLATADFDNDGAVDAAFIDLMARPVLLRNSPPAGNHWVGVDLRGVDSPRDATGARLVLRSTGQVMTRWVTGGGSFLASHDRRVVFGLGGVSEAPALTIYWPRGGRQELPSLEIDRYHTIQEAKKGE